MHYLKLVIHSVLLFTVPSFAAHPGLDVPVVTTTQRSLQNDRLLSYDDVLNLIDDLERGELEKRYGQADLERINYLLANLAKQGLLPDEIEEGYILENDIQELLEDSPHEYSFALSDGYAIASTFINSEGEVILCKGWLSKKWDKAKKFVKKHKKAIIIGTAVVVGVALVVGVIAAASAGAATAGAAASGPSKEGKDTSDMQTAPPSSMPFEDSSSAMPSASEASILKSVMEEQVTSFKENIAKEQFLKPSLYSDSSLGENGRILGSLFAHDSFGSLCRRSYDHPQLAEELRNIRLQNHLPVSGGVTHTSFASGHLEIDRKFSTDYAPLYANSSKEADFNTLTYQLRGEKALASGQLDQAVHDLGKAIELSPTNPMLYLERGVAYFGLRQYDRSIEDYRHFTSQAPKKPSPSIPDFSLGFARGLPRGIYESGEGIFLFLTDLISHPVQTGGQMWEALTLLSDLARSEQWNVLSEVLAPEVHQLVKEWDSLPSARRGELAGYAFGKYGSDIIIPGALTKAVSRGLKGTQELSVIYKGLQTAEKTLLLESAARLESGAKVAEVVQTTQNAVILGEELGFTAREMVQLKQAGKLEETVSHTFKNISSNSAMRESFELFSKAESFLEPYCKRFLPEKEARELIHQAGIRTFPRPVGLPENFRVRISKSGAGMLYIHPEHTHTSVRVMPGKPYSPNPSQQKPYVIYKKDGKTLDKFGNVVDFSSTEAHIPLDGFVYFKD